MQTLPTFDFGRYFYSLPIADRSVETLLRLLLFLTDPDLPRDPIATGGVILDDPLAADPFREPSDEVSLQWCTALAESLASDLSLLLWTICTADRLEAAKLDTVTRASRWLFHRATLVLKFDQLAPIDPPDGSKLPAEKLDADSAVLLQYSFFLSEMSAELLEDENETTVQRARLRALLHNADQWLDTCRTDSPEGDNSSRRSSSPLPAWLKRRPGGAIGRALNAASDDTTDEKATKAARRSADARAKKLLTRWKENRTAAIARLFPTIIARLVRLTDLTVRHERTLWEEKLESVAEFAAGAGHEMNNPLAVISGWAQMMMRGAADDDTRWLLAKIVSQVKRVHEMIADMIVFARPPLPDQTEFELVAAVRETVDTASRVDWEVDVHFELTAQPEEITIQSDRGQIATIVSALCRNSAESLRLSARSGRVDVRLEVAESNVVISVTDDGPGISEPAARHLFDPYYSERQAGRGLGLGLSKSWRLVEQLGGRIEVKSSSEDGTTVRVVLPLQLER